MNKFPVLSFVSELLKFVGWLSFCGGIIVLAIPFVNMEDYASSAALFTSFNFLAGLVLLPFGLGTVALGESIGVLFAIERNTRAQVFKPAPTSTAPTKSNAAVATVAAREQSEVTKPSNKKASFKDAVGDGTPLFKFQD